MFQFAGFKDFDWTMFFVVMVICGLGVLQIFSATHDTVWQGSWWKQMLYIISGLLLMWVVTNIDYHSLMGQVYPMYIASVVMLALVLFVGKRAFGSTRWIALPTGIHLQIFEFAKIVIVLLEGIFLAGLRWKYWAAIGVVALVVVPLGFTVLQPYQKARIVRFLDPERD